MCNIHVLVHGGGGGGGGCKEISKNLTLIVPESRLMGVTLMDVYP